MKLGILKILLLLVLVISLTGCWRSKNSFGSAKLTIYGLDNSDVFEGIIGKYRTVHPEVTVKYKKFDDLASYENLMVNEIAEGEGPDVFMIHNTWLPRHAKKLTPKTSEAFTPKNFAETFVNVAAEDFVLPDPRDGVKKIFAMPFFVDTLALYYNKRDFEQKFPERGKPAATWDRLKTEADLLRVQNASGELQHGAVALGRSDNISLATDILYNLFLQANVPFYSDDYKTAKFAAGGGESFEYFLSFGQSQNKNFSWNTELVPASGKLKEIGAFLSGKVSAIFAYSDLYPRLETELKNVKAAGLSALSLADIGVMPIPQISDISTDWKALASYYGLAVSRNTKYTAAAWDFVQFATSEASAKMYHEKTKRPTARRDLIEEQKKEPITDVFVSQLGIAGSVKVFNKQTFDEIFTAAIQESADGRVPREALQEAQKKVDGLLHREAPDGLYPKPPAKKK